MEWFTASQELFAVDKPAHFTDYNHCCECAEHDKTLLNSSIETISLHELGNPAWDPICFATAEGIAYYFPALIRLSLETMESDDFYFEQLLFHLEIDWENNRFYQYCNDQQKQFVASFIEHIITTCPDQLEKNQCADDALRALELWQA